MYILQTGGYTRLLICNSKEITAVRQTSENGNRESKVGKPLLALQTRIKECYEHQHQQSIAIQIGSTAIQEDLAGYARFHSLVHSFTNFLEFEDTTYTASKKSPEVLHKLMLCFPDFIATCQSHESI